MFVNKMNLKQGNEIVEELVTADDCVILNELSILGKHITSCA